MTDQTPRTDAGVIHATCINCGHPFLMQFPDRAAIEAQARTEALDDNFMCHEQYAKGRADALRELRAALDKTTAVLDDPTKYIYVNTHYRTGWVDALRAVRDDPALAILSAEETP